MNSNLVAIDQDLTRCQLTKMFEGHSRERVKQDEQNPTVGTHLTKRL